MGVNVTFQVDEDVTITVTISASDTIRHVKEKIQSALGIAISNQIIIVDGEFLEDHDYVLSTRMFHPGAIILFSLNPYTQNILPPTPPPPLRNPRSWTHPALYHPLGVITQPMPPTTPLVLMLPRHQVFSMPASALVARRPAITPFLRSPEIAQVVHVPARTPMVQAPERTQVVGVPASTTVAQATERSIVCRMPQWKPVVRRWTGSPVFPMQNIQSNIVLKELAPDTEKEAPAARSPVLPMQQMRSDIELEELTVKKRKVTVNIVDCGGKIPVETEWDGTTILILKQKILEDLKTCGAGFDMEHVTVERMLLQCHLTHRELFDDVLLKDCLISEDPEIDLLLETVASSGC
ncbi:hypothetical protein DEO72_LG9g3413 [Vigna unguiculata]|uniref:Ubiquitin-like domain-containing protein n=1 Tax=Vigna unguiculata TaxID=3917 RepID=A0A4D6N6A6_VIGUN|nr:hypothetical protein DEO72_LG9g3413 [Vigna unguiculata]